ncbi:bifunctional diaminohydroxyphosphoribosylaminopyrimidine deaminase/5-amino-6-(5-phosphoribosylamino)uracil reductase RibD [Clostridioides difficile]|uniref:Riboflavin biosynthesis protein RibD n=2 Tax=Clostridioides difficile TaxID=1496 RepID=A0AAX3H3T0_CLODI|nr:bifunctional diaminohydroxyphosphoribosylaminopyrimidine deaminase/5-amino-6-(5-phosphoribosylamino)uracil reductase RibD [Clostridioides difficile]AVD35139.1 bifunctional diaminohydroxyphosphoribosylaminopyrimidine deaminase/5-amino-6-(5-phosphoribosylamino)uracil reductase RibD [Clostridioides difficile]AVD38001.1 bifunctional diaminohydroxyphosphoribosylaminopyrimidine deaminase/5-amino-6-(5-phosphoribosylamino)uracil reductase RibD [Clostridioides difficile]AVD41529.1 bifunctional diamino
MNFVNQKEKDIYYMKKAIELAKNGEGFVNPNPLVGCVIVKDDYIIGKGYHEKFGSNHAEVNAINSAKQSLKDSTLYVNLEPCSHYGKTPPCVDKIIQNKIKRVVISTLDPNPLVCGNGVKKLRDNNIDVTVGTLEEEARDLNEVFFYYIKNKRPLCIVKSAVSLDGKIATKSLESKWISNESSRYLTHKYRNKYQSIMVGINTVLNDNPLLTCRLNQEKVSHPTRIVIDTHLKLPLNSNLVKDKTSKTIVFTCCKESKKLSMLKENNVETIISPSKNNLVDLEFVMYKLGELNIDSVLVEGGATLNDSLFRNRLVDKVKLFLSPKIIGGKDAPTFVSGEGINHLSDSTQLAINNVTLIDGDILIESDVLN